MTTIELLRHAKAQARDGWWDRPDRERPLTELGRKQAVAICRALLVEGPVDACYSSPFVRCTATVEPLAHQLGIEVHEDAGLTEATTVPVLDGGDAWVASAWLAGRALAFVDRVVVDHEGRRIVACSHGDVIPALLAALVGRDGLDLADVRCKKGARVTLAFDGDRCVAAESKAAPDV